MKTFQRAKKHVKGKRGAKFRQKTKGFRPCDILGVAIDISKTFHRVMIFNFEGEVLRAPFEIDVFAEGYKELLGETNRLAGASAAKKIFWVMEPTGAYYENLARHLNADGHEVLFANPSQVSSNRDQTMLHGLKSDDVDLGAMADLLMRGECYFYNLEEGVYLELKEMTWWREKKLKMQTMLKNQIRARLDKLYPGLTSEYRGNRPLFSDIWANKGARGLMKTGLTPGQILSLRTDSLRKKFREAGYPITASRAKQIKEYIGSMLLPDDRILAADIELLRRDVKFLEILEAELAEVEVEMVEGVKKTPWSHLLGRLKGVGDILIASYAGAVGDITRFDRGAQIFRKSGLDSKRKQSGEYEARGLPIRRMGSSLLRCILYKIADSAIKSNPYFGLYYEYMTAERKKLSKKAHIAVCNKLTRVTFAMVRDKAEFNPPTVKIDYLNVMFSRTKEERKQRRKERKNRREKASLDSSVLASRHRVPGKADSLHMRG